MEEIQGLIGFKYIRIFKRDLRVISAMTCYHDQKGRFSGNIFIHYNGRELSNHDYYDLTEYLHDREILEKALIEAQNE